ncbi:hypothetical protein [Azospirillum thermophilum]|uniref:hypothetical protein n=1 Tax=Azospirillum thermophilum TaxID=2202148 RepID=UPI0015E8C909|nr:hypothetical protein [Azospirillum thermophilum]
MDESFIAKPLGRRQIDQAYPLICAISPGLAVERWRAFAAALLDRNGQSALPAGIMTVQNANGYIHGLFSYAVEEDLRHGPALVVDNFVVMDLFDLGGAAEVLLRAMEALAARLGCTAIHTNLPEAYAILTGAENPVMACFRGQGHRMETMRLCKPLGGANDNGSRDGDAAGCAGSDGGEAAATGRTPSRPLRHND